MTLDEGEVFDGRAEVAAQGARQNVADQLVELLVEGQPSGSRNLVALRVRAVIEAESWREDRVLRGAIMELAVAAAAWAATLDTQMTEESHLRRAPNR